MLMSEKNFLKSHALIWRRKSAFNMEKYYSFWHGVPGLFASNWESTAIDDWSLERWHQKTIGACRTKRPSARKTAYWHQRSKVWRCTSVNSECQQGDLAFNPLRNAHWTSEEWSPMRQSSVPTVVAVRGMLVSQPVQHSRSPVLTVPMLPPVTGMWPVALNDGSVCRLQSTVTPFVV